MAKNKGNPAAGPDAEAAGDAQLAPGGPPAGQAANEAVQTEQAAQGPQTAPNGKPSPQTDDGKSVLVRVRLRRSIAFDGVAIRPQIDASGRSKGMPPVVTPVEAIMPRRLVGSYGPNYVEVLASAPDGAKVGRV